MLNLDFKKKDMKEEKDFALMENSKGYWDESYCYISERRWHVKYLEKCASHCLV